MGTLIKVDFLRIFKNKLFIIGIIVAASFAILIPLLYLAMQTADSVVYGSTSTYAILSVMPVGFILALFFSIITGQEYSFGTIRNKIIIGKKRSHIYFSIFFTTTVTYMVMMIGTGLLTGLVSLILFKDFFPAGYNVAEFFMNIGFVTICYLAISSLIALFSLGFNKVALSIIFVGVGGTFLGSVLPLIFAMTNPSSEVLKVVYKSILSADYFYVLGLYLTLLTGSTFDGFIGQFFAQMVRMETYQIIITVISPIVFFALNYFLGLLSFKRRNIK